MRRILPKSKMPRRVSVVASMLVFVLVSGLTMAFPLANAQSTVMVTIPSGSGAAASAAPGYSPDKITVVIGVNNTVTWTNGDTVDHTVTSSSVPNGASTFDSGSLAPNAVFMQTFTIAGTYQYHCNIHSWMSGTIVVEAASTSTTTHTTPEFPAAYLAVILFAVIAAVIVVAARLRQTLPASSAIGRAKSRFVQTAT
jgi:plastocyanin